MPYTRYRNTVLHADPMDDDIWRRDDQFAGASLTAQPATVRKQDNAVPGENRIIGRNISNDAPDIGQRACAPYDGHVSTRDGRRSVEFALGQPQKPRSDFVMRGDPRICVGLGGRRGHKPALSLIVVDQRCDFGHGGILSQGDARFISRFIVAVESIAPSSNHDQERRPDQRGEHPQRRRLR